MSGAHRRKPGATVSGPSRLTRAVGWLVTALEAYVAVLMVALAIIVLLGVWFRYVVQRALPWYDECTEFLLVWLTFNGSALTAKRGAPNRFDTLTDTLPRGLRRYARMIPVTEVRPVLMGSCAYIMS